MARVGARREREGTVPRATAVPRLAKPARHAGTRPARIARSADAAAAVKPPAFGVLDRPRTEASAARAVPRLSRRLSPAATCGARGSPSVPLSRPVPTRDVSRVGLVAGVHGRGDAEPYV